MIKALIFDFDGLILETEGPEFLAWQEVFEDHGCQLTLSDWANAIGRPAHLSNPLHGLEEKLGRPLDKEALHEGMRSRFYALVAEQELLPGVEDYIAEARRLGLKLGLASSSPRRWIMGHLSRFGLDVHFDAIRSLDDVAHGKPDPELYLSAMDALGVTADEAIALEDSPIGSLAAKRAGLFCVAVPHALTRELDLSHADLRLNSLSELPLTELLEKVNKQWQKG